jgi:glutamine synthetase
MMLTPAPLFSLLSPSPSVRIPRTAFADKKGYFEDRRPASNMDPYVVTSMIYQTCCL